MGEMAARILSRGRYTARYATGARDLARAQSLRHMAFVTGRGHVAREGALDADRFDPPSRHVLVEDACGALVCCFRMRSYARGGEIAEGYAAQVYDLRRLAMRPGPMVEIGRFCLHPDRHDPDILRLAWGALTRLVDAQGVGFLFGCTSFDGGDVAPYAAVLARLAAAHLAPPDWRPGRKAAETIELSGLRPSAGVMPRAMPPLLRSYLAMGGRVSDHAVRDPELDTLHVFTGVEIAAIPPARARLLRAIAAEP